MAGWSFQATHRSHPPLIDKAHNLYLQHAMDRCGKRQGGARGPGMNGAGADRPAGRPWRLRGRPSQASGRAHPDASPLPRPPSEQAWQRRVAERPSGLQSTGSFKFPRRPQAGVAALGPGPLRRGLVTGPAPANHARARVAQGGGAAAGGVSCDVLHAGATRPSSKVLAAEALGGSGATRGRIPWTTPSRQALRLAQESGAEVRASLRRHRRDPPVRAHARPRADRGRAGTSARVVAPVGRRGALASGIGIAPCDALDGDVRLVGVQAGRRWRTVRRRASRGARCRRAGGG